MIVCDSCGAKHKNLRVANLKKGSLLWQCKECNVLAIIKIDMLQPATTYPLSK